MNLDIKRVVAYRYWCNKLWNAIKFAMMNLPDGFVPPTKAELSAGLPTYPLASQWVLSRLNGTTAAVVAALEAYDFAAATQKLYAFWQYDLCDVFIELMKPVMGLADDAPGAAAAKAATRSTLWVALESGLRLLHPFMPFVTEELWQRLPRRSGDDDAHVASIMLAPYPEFEAELARPQLEVSFDYVQAVVSAARKLRSDYGLALRQKPALFVTVSSDDKRAVLASLASEVAALCTSSGVAVLPGDAPTPPGCSVAIVDDATTVKMQLAGILDPALEIQKLEKKAAEMAARIEGMRSKMDLPAYDKTPDSIKAEDAEKLAKTVAELAANVTHIAEFRRL
jgi:valyl-tRNA synthetase